MAVQQNKKSPSKRGMHRSHDHLPTPPMAVEQQAPVGGGRSEDEHGGGGKMRDRGATVSVC